MAELFLGITGVVLAWKGILDFGDLLLKISEDDSRQREGLSIRLQVSQYLLKDWGDTWGIDRNDGKFHTLEPSRKELIMKIIFRLHDSRLKALEVLKNRYKLPGNQTEEDDDSKADHRLSRMVDRVKGASKRMRDKGNWLTHDRSEIRNLVCETMELHENLQYLTYGSPKFISHAAFDNQFAIQAGLSRMENEDSKPSTVTEKSAKSDLHVRTIDLDEQTLASYATKSIVSANQAARITQQLNRSFYFYGHSCIPEKVYMWWNDELHDIMLLEVTELAEDDTSSCTCALVYYLAPGLKLIYSLDSDSLVEPERQFVEMLRTLTIRMLTLGDLDQFSGISLPPAVIEMENEPPSIDTIQQLITAFHQILEILASRCEARILFVIDGVDYIGATGSDPLASLLQSFVSGFKATCSTSQVKILIGCKGHATSLYDVVEDQGIVDITDCPMRTLNIMHELAVWL